MQVPAKSESRNLGQCMQIPFQAATGEAWLVYQIDYGRGVPRPAGYRHGMPGHRVHIPKV